ncbi:serine hydrolase domain-containing protein [Pedobacter gandavensis]|uniref:serine hydrolase domain-containing protein n=1 Tax=Pedobacter gandavensis TaxID=2679963 RepID=UPI00293004A3|nr:serine hydrolase domain-containing protein [Pedobacter gandavensis]
MKTSVKLLAALLLIANFAFGQDITKQIDSILLDNYKKNPNIGISVGFIKDNKEHYTAYGKLNAESQTPIDKNAVFELASITKILTSNLIAQAVVEHKIKIDDYIDNYLPKAYVLQNQIKGKIRISDLASHQSGLPDIDFAKLIAENPQQPVDNVNQETLAGIINNCTELADYGKYRYSTIGYTLLGQILENVYGKSYDEIVTLKMVKPLKLKNTLTKDFNVKNLTTAHNPEGGVQEFFKWNIMAAAGLIKSSSADMVTYLKAVLDEKSAFGKASILSEKTFYEDQKRALGLGLNIVGDDHNTLYMKSGDSMGQSTIICYNRAKNWGIIILLDQRNSQMRNNLLNEINRIALK